jgi:hypothetical protein
VASLASGGCAAVVAPVFEPFRLILL